MATSLLKKRPHEPRKPKKQQEAMSEKNIHIPPEIWRDIFEEADVASLYHCNTIRDRVRDYYQKSMVIVLQDLVETACKWRDLRGTDARIGPLPHILAERCRNIYGLEIEED